MRRLVLIGLVLAASGCSWFRAPPPVQQITPGARLIYHGGQPVWVTCSRGDRIYLTTSGQFQVVGGACPDGEP